MKLTVLVCVCLLAASASGQWLETTIPPRDSLGGVTSPRFLVWDSLDNKLFAGGAGGVLVVDGATNERIARVLPGSTASALSYNPQNNKVYCANLSSGDVTVIDGASNAVLTTVAAGNSPSVLCYSPENNKVYCANRTSNDVTVIDGASDSVVTTIGVGSGPQGVVLNPAENRVYVANSYGSSVSVIRDGVGVEETPDASRLTHDAGATVRGSIEAEVLFDTQGRRVTNPGPGVYFVRELVAGSTE